MGGATPINLFSAAGGEKQIKQMFVDAENGNGNAPNTIDKAIQYLEQNPAHVFIIGCGCGCGPYGRVFKMYYKSSSDNKYKSYQIGENPSTKMLQFKNANGQEVDTNVIYKTGDNINYEEIANHIYNNFRTPNHFT